MGACGGCLSWASPKANASSRKPALLPKGQTSAPAIPPLAAPRAGPSSQASGVAPLWAPRGGSDPSGSTKAAALAPAVAPPVTHLGLLAPRGGFDAAAGETAAPLIAPRGVHHGGAPYGSAATAAATGTSTLAPTQDFPRWAARPDHTGLGAALQSRNSSRSRCSSAGSSGTSSGVESPRRTAAPPARLGGAPGFKCDASPTYGAAAPVPFIAGGAGFPHQSVAAGVTTGLPMGSRGGLGVPRGGGSHAPLDVGVRSGLSRAPAMPRLPLATPEKK